MIFNTGDQQAEALQALCTRGRCERMRHVLLQHASDELPIDVLATTA